MRVQILKDFVKQHFPSTQLLDYALDVEKITTSKVPKLGRGGGAGGAKLRTENRQMFNRQTDPDK